MPTSVLETIRELVRQLGCERTVILSSHIMQEITTICQKVAIINKGSLVAFDTIANLSAAMSAGQRLLVTVARPEKVDCARLAAVPHVLSVESQTGGVFLVLGEAACDVREAVAKELQAMDAGLLELLVKMTALQPQGFGAVGHAIVMTLEFRQQDVTFESLDPLRQRAGGGGGFRRRGGRRQRQTHGSHVHLFAREQ